MPKKDGDFKLTVPLDASRIKDLKPGRAVKVVAYDRKGRAYEDVAKLDDKGMGKAVLSFPQSPGGLRVVIGPENASAEELKGLQTISTDVSARQWQDKRELSLPAIAISSYYWRWWWWWCRDFKITGRVVCADGSPVPGAQVCAYDVDWWWWWWSQDLVGCATTDATGSFEIDFKRCCGWWPWWWWVRRQWVLEPTLVERITSLLRQEPKFRRIPIPSPKPSPAVFQELLGERGPSVGPGLAQAPAFNAGQLDSLRTRLLQVLPAATEEFNRLRLWPWWPWWPWWDCDADIIFKVTQNCTGQDTVIVNETLWNTRWDIPTDFNVTLVANDQACCLTTCTDPNQCPQGDCVLLSDICDDNVGSIGGNLGAPASPVGLLNPYTGGVADYSNDRPYSVTVPIKGNVGDTVDYYEFQYSTAGFGGPWSPLPLAAVGGFSRLYFPGVPPWVPKGFPATTISDGVTDHYVIETLAHYDANNGTLLTNWDASTKDLLMGFTTQGVLANGTYYLQMTGWTRPGYVGNLKNPRVLPVCDSENPNGIVVTIDNHVVSPGPTDANGHSCIATDHQCTIQPDTAILAVKILHHDGTSTDVGACGQQAITDTDMLQIDFAAYDPNQYLAYYTLELHYGDSIVCSLLDSSLPGWSLTSSPIPPLWAPAAAQVGPYYGYSVVSLSALNQGAVSPYWGGGAIRLVVKAKGDPNGLCQGGAFPYTCCYLLQLVAHKRTIGGSTYGCDHSYWNQYNISEISFTITV